MSSRAYPLDVDPRLIDATEQLQAARAEMGRLRIAVMILAGQIAQHIRDAEGIAATCELVAAAEGIVHRDAWHAAADAIRTEVAVRSCVVRVLDGGATPAEVAGAA